MYRRTIRIAILPVAALICMSAWGQVAPSSGGPRASQPSSGDNSAAVSPDPGKVAALKKQEERESRKNAAAAADAAKKASSAPPK